MLINHLRWYLIILIDFFSRYIIGHNIHPSINASHVKHLYAMGLKSQGILPKDILPELRVDRGSPNTSWVTKVLSLMGADISFARVEDLPTTPLRRDFSVLPNRKKSMLWEVILMNIRPSLRSVTYIDSYNTERPHQSLWNFTPALVHETNNNTLLLEKLSLLKYEAKIKRRLYWEGANQ